MVMASEHEEGGAKKCEWNKVCHNGTHHMDATTKLSMAVSVYASECI